MILRIDMADAIARLEQKENQRLLQPDRQVEADARQRFSDRQR